MSRCYIVWKAQCSGSTASGIHGVQGVQGIQGVQEPHSPGASLTKCHSVREPQRSETTLFGSTPRGRSKGGPHCSGPALPGVTKLLVSPCDADDSRFHKGRKAQEPELP